MLVTQRANTDDAITPQGHFLATQVHLPAVIQCNKCTVGALVCDDELAATMLDL